jgi:hypothetical protein
MNDENKCIDYYWLLLYSKLKFKRLNFFIADVKFYSVFKESFRELFFTPNARFWLV